VAAGPTGRKPGGSTPAKAPGSAQEGTVSAEIKAAARSAAASLETDLKILRVARVLTIASHIITLITSLQMLNDFVSITEKSLAGKGFILTDEIKKAEDLEHEATDFENNYKPYSESIGAIGGRLWSAHGDPVSAGRTYSHVSDLRLRLTDIEQNLPERVQKIENAFRAVRAKENAAQAILDSPEASRAIVIASWGSTAQLAQIFAVHEDLLRIGSTLERTLNSLKNTDTMLKSDISFLDSWGESLFSTCERGGACFSHKLEVPFVGTINMRFLPGEAPKGPTP
jgi:hypothetical protein